MNDDIRFDIGDKLQDCIAIPNVDVEMVVARDRATKALESPTGISLRPEEDRPLVVIDAEYLEAFARQMSAYFRSDKAAGAGDKGGFSHSGRAAWAMDPMKL